MTLKQTQGRMEELARNIPAEDRSRFYAVIETEFNGLHEGNIVRYRLREEEWTTWRSKWDQETQERGDNLRRDLD